MLKSTTYINRGISLMEVLASTFVISVGLLGVLAVIPYGAFQVSKARDAEHTSNMLAAAAEDIRVNDFVKPKSWNPAGDTETNQGAPTIFNHSNERLLYGRILMIDPLASDGNNPSHIYRIGKNFASRPEERMRGQDDLLYTIHSDKRTDFAANGDEIMSSGKYTWFLTFRPTLKPDVTGTGMKDLTDFNRHVTVDLLGCYNRVPGEEKTNASISSVTKTTTGAMLELSGSSAEDLDLSNTKYIFVTWSSGSSWCRVLYATQVSDNKRQVLVTGGLADMPANLSNVNVLIVPGVLYRKSIPNVALY